MDSIKVMAFQSLTENPSLEAEISNYEHMRYTSVHILATVF